MTRAATLLGHRPQGALVTSSPQAMLMGHSSVAATNDAACSLVLPYLRIPLASAAYALPCLHSVSICTDNATEARHGARNDHRVFNWVRSPDCLGLDGFGVR